MLFHLASWLVLVVSGAAVGCFILAITKSSAFTHFGDRMITATWLGLLVMASLLLGLSVLMPLKLGVGLGLMAILTAGCLSMKGVRRDFGKLRELLTAPAALGIGFLAVVTAFTSTRVVDAYDTGLYHYQLTKWLAQYGTIPGISLIHIVFGFSSSWFALAAPFDSGPFQGRTAALLGGLAILLCFLHFALALARIIQRRAERSDWFLMGGYTVVFGVCLAWEFEVSLSPDVPAWILHMLAGWLMVVTYQRGQRDSSDHSAILPLVLALGAGAIKLSAAPVVAVAVIFYWPNSPANWLTRIVASCVPGLFLIPKAATGVVGAGCPFFPSPVLCQKLPWAFSKEAARVASENIRDWARWSGPMPDWANNWNWMLPWIKHLDRLALVTLCALCLLGFLMARGWRMDKSLRYVAVLALFGTAFIFITAPNPRFGAGYLALYPALLMAAIGPWLRELFPLRLIQTNHLKTASTIAFAMMLVAVLVGLEAETRDIKLRREVRSSGSVHMPSDSTVASRLLLPPVMARSEGDLIIIKNRRMDLLESLDLVNDNTNGFAYQHPREGDQCWGAALPCTPRTIDSDVVLRSPEMGVRAGFVRSPNSENASQTQESKGIKQP